MFMADDCHWQWLVATWKLAGGRETVSVEISILLASRRDLFL